MAMYKIIAAINSMITNQQLITHVVKSGSRFYFIYDTKFKWSIAKTNDGDFSLDYYPGKESLEELVSIFMSPVWDSYEEYVTYSTKELKTKEAVESFSELYQVIQTKLYSIDEVLDSIINTAA